MPQGPEPHRAVKAPRASELLESLSRSSIQQSLVRLSEFFVALSKWARQKMEERQMRKTVEHATHIAQSAQYPPALHDGTTHGQSAAHTPSMVHEPSVAHEQGKPALSFAQELAKSPPSAAIPNEPDRPELTALGNRVYPQQRRDSPRRLRKPAKGPGREQTRERSLTKDSGRRPRKLRRSR